MLNQQIIDIYRGLDEVEGEMTPVQKALKSISKTRAPGKTTGKKGGKGRKPSRRNIRREQAAASRQSRSTAGLFSLGASDGECLHNNLERMADIVMKFVQQAHALNDNWKEIESKCDVYRCRDCRRFIVKFPEDADIPVSPLRTLGSSVIAQTLHLLFNGMALNRIEDTFMTKLCLGSNTLYDNCWKWCELYGERMVRMIIDHAGKEASALIADGTPFDCLENEGRGVVPEKNRVDSVTSSQTYVMAVGTLPDISTPYTCYMPAKSRSSESIFEVLRQFPATSITCDGYVGYSCLGGEQGKMSNVEFGCCNVHLRRECIEGAALPQFVSIRKTKPDADHKQFVVEQLQSDSPYFAMVGIVDAMSKISAIEGSIPPQGEAESREAYEARILKVRQEQEKPLYESIDQLFIAIAPKVAEETATGKWKAKVTTPYTKAVLYYMNRRKKLQRFLENPRIPFSTNQIERAIRPMTMVRRAMNFVQSSNGMKGICTAMSLFETARLNGIEDPVGWLMDFTKSMLKFCMEERLTELDAAGKLNLDRQIQQWWLDKHLSKFDETRFLPWNYRG